MPGDGNEGIHSVFVERGKVGGALAVVLFDVLQLDGRDVMREPWSHRRKRREDLVAAAALPGIAVVPITEDAAHLWDVWVGQGGGEGIVLKLRWLSH